MQQLLSNRWRIVGWLVPVAIALLLITTTVRFTANSLPLFEALFERNQVTARTGISTEGLADVGRQVQAYFADSSSAPLQVTAAVNGVERELFNEEEVSHMADVKALFLRTYRVQSAAALLLAVFTLIAAWRFRGEVYPTIAIWLRRGAVLTGVIILTLGILSIVAFDQLFTVFHYIGFPQGNWLFNPSTDYLVRVFPFGFWQDVTLFIGMLTLMEAAVLWTIGFAVPVLTGIRVRRSEASTVSHEHHLHDAGASGTGTPQDDRLVRLEVYPNEMLARLSAEFLEREGVASVVRPEQGGYGLMGHTQFIMHGLWVLIERVDEARALLAELDSTPAE